MTYDEIQTAYAAAKNRQAQIDREIAALMPTEPDEIYGSRYIELPIGSPEWHAQQQAITARMNEREALDSEMYKLALAELEVI